LQQRKQDAAQNQTEHYDDKYLHIFNPDG
jgi:hypothetical protein